MCGSIQTYRLTLTNLSGEQPKITITIIPFGLIKVVKIHRIRHNYSPFGYVQSVLHLCTVLLWWLISILRRSPVNARSHRDMTVLYCVQLAQYIFPPADWLHLKLRKVYRMNKNILHAKYVCQCMTLYPPYYNINTASIAPVHK